MWQRHLPLFLIPILISCVGLVISYTDSFSVFRAFSDSQTIPSILAESGRTGKELRLLEYGHLANVRLESFATEIAPSDMPSSKNIEEIARQSLLPTLSIVINSDNLLNRDAGLLSNLMNRGRNWERPAYVSYFDAGQLRFASGAGLRIHGGKSRLMQIMSFRLYFREMYGMSKLSADYLFGDEASPIRSVVVHNDVRKNKDSNWHYVNPIAYELAREIGCITPSTQPVQFYLNSVYQGPYVLTEHISVDYLKAHFGHDNFTIAEMKIDVKSESGPVEIGNRRLFEEFVNWSKSAPAPLQISDVAGRIDLANFTNWIISIVYAGVTDPFQGVALLDETDTNARWFWISWDMDHAFSDRYYQVDVPWKIDSFRGLAGVLVSKKLRSVILNRLRLESPEYRHYFVSRVTEVLNHILTPEKVAEKVAYYRQVAIDHGIVDSSYLDIIREFGEERPAVLRNQLNMYFEAGDSYRLSISNPMGVNINVDGYSIADDYIGWYFANTPARIEISDSDRQSVRAVSLNGDEIPMSEGIIELHLTADTDLEFIRPHYNNN